jgi:BASS family bile acid:Na+ symporter
LGILVILFLVVTWIPRNHQLLATTPFVVYFAAIGLGLFGMALGYALSRLLRQDANRSRTIALETGIQNGPLAVLIVTLSFAGTMQQDILLIPVLYSLFIVISSSLVTVVFRRRSDREALARDKAKAGQLASS